MSISKERVNLNEILGIKFTKPRQLKHSLNLLMIKIRGEVFF